MKRSVQKRMRTATERAIDLIAIGGLVFGFGVFVRDVALQEIANPPVIRPKLPSTPAGHATVAENWATTRPHLAATLRQRNLELGAVWSTRDGRICGLVNGWGSFGGLTGMVRFYTEGDTFAFSVDPPSDFYTTWRVCQADQWQMLHKASEEPGFCATKLGRRRCSEIYGR